MNDAITELTAGRADFAVIPQENTLGGAVTNYVDALIGEKSVYVVGEVILPISQTLMGIPGTKIEDVITKQQTDKVSGMENVRFAGCFDVIEKKPS